MSTLTGVVTSNKMKNAVVVKVTRLVKHPLYGKAIKRTRNFKARTDKELAIGTVVKIASSRPLSRDIHHTVAQVLSTETKG